jgi:hypothetical protein
LKVIGIYILILTLGLLSCSSNKVKETIESKSDTSIDEKLKLSCLMKDNALSCAKYAYFVQRKNPSESLKFYSKGCELGDDSSCYNYKSIMSKTADNNLLLLKKEQLKEFGCYVNYTKDKDKKSFYDLSYSTKTITLDALISQKGKLKSISIKNGKFSDAGKKCMRRVFKSVQFLSSKEGQRLQLSFVMPEVYNKDGEQDFLEEAVDSLKDVD